jgi:gas vesicle protein
VEEERADNFSYGDFATGFLVGAVGGFLAGILVAPRSGEETREGALNQASDIRSSLQQLLNKGKDSLGVALDKLEGLLGLEERSIRRKLSQLREEVERYSTS